MANRLVVFRDEQERIVKWSILDQPEVDGLERAAARRSIEKAIESGFHTFNRTLVENGLSYPELLGRVEELRANKMTYAEIAQQLVGTGKMLPLKQGESLLDLVKGVKKLKKKRDALIEELNGMPI